MTFFFCRSFSLAAAAAATAISRELCTSTTNLRRAARSLSLSPRELLGLRESIKYEEALQEDDIPRNRDAPQFEKRIIYIHTHTRTRGAREKETKPTIILCVFFFSRSSAVECIVPLLHARSHFFFFGTAQSASAPLIFAPIITCGDAYRCMYTRRIASTKKIDF